MSIRRLKGWAAVGAVLVWLMTLWAVFESALTLEAANEEASTWSYE